MRRFIASRGPGYVVYADQVPRELPPKAYEILCAGFPLDAPRKRVDIGNGIRVSAAHGHRWTGKFRGLANGAWMLCVCGQWYGTRGVHRRIRIA